MSNKKSREDWKNEVYKYQKSGLSINGFCRDNDISPSTFIYWKKKFGSPAIKTPPPLVKVTNPIKLGEKMKLSYNQVIVEFPTDLPADKISLLISVLKEI